MSNTAALKSEFQVVIPGKFVTQRNGNPMHCVTCGSVLVLGATFAAKTSTGGWVSYCGECAASMPFQIRGLVTKLTDMGVVISDEAREATVAFLTGESVATFLAAKSALMNVRQTVGAAQREAAMASAPDLTVIPTGRYEQDGQSFKIDNVATGKWGGWVFVKTGSGEKIGNQRPGQRYTGPCADVLAALIATLATLALEAAEAEKPLLTTVPEGYFATASATGNNDLDFWRVQEVPFVTFGSAMHAVQVQRVIGGHPDTPVRRATAEAALRAIEAATPYVAGLTYANEIGRCMKCNRHLTDEVSRSYGLGETCRNG